VASSKLFRSDELRLPDERAYPTIIPLSFKTVESLRYEFLVPKFGGEKRIDTGLLWTRRAADQGKANAEYNMGVLCKNG